jgi:hypothetical protein
VSPRTYFALVLGAAAAVGVAAACTGSDPIETTTPTTTDGGDEGHIDVVDSGGADAQLQDASPPIPSPEVAALSVGATHACVLRKDGRVLCWGSNKRLQLGSADVSPAGAVEVTFPTVVPAVTAVAIGAGNQFTCIEDSVQRVWCWGDNSYGQLGNDMVGFPSGGTSTPVRVVDTVGPLSARPGDPALYISSEANHACVGVAGGALECWGLDAQKQLGFGTAVQTATADRAGVAPPVTTAAAGLLATCAIEKSQGTPRVACWGRDLEKMLSDIGSTNSAVPTFPAVSGEPRLVRVGASHACAVDITGKMSCWGSNSAGQLGPTTITTDPGITPPYADTDYATDKIVDVGLGYRFTCVLLDSGLVYCQGLNSYTQLSGLTTPDETPHSTRVKVRIIDDAIGLGVGDRFA